MYTGLTGALKLVDSIDSIAPMAYISGWNISENTEIIETSKIDDINKSGLAGQQSWSASADGAVAFESKDSQEKLFKAKYLGEKIRVQFYLNNQGDDKKSAYFEGSCYIESLSVDLSATDKGNISISVIGDGPLDLWIDGRNVRFPEPIENRAISLFIDSGGHLKANVPEGKESIIYLDKNNHLIIKL